MAGVWPARLLQPVRALRSHSASYRTQGAGNRGRRIARFSAAVLAVGMAKIAIFQLILSDLSAARRLAPLALGAALTVAAGLVASAHAGPALLFDAADGKVLYAENADDEWHPASLTKVMTAYIAFEEMKAGRLKYNDSKLAVSKRAHDVEPSKIGLPIGAEMTLDTALKALIVKSANDVAVMFAEKISGSVDAFASRMNTTAKRLGMTRTHFVNPHGLPADEQISTARDLAHLSRAVAKDFPEHAHYFAMPRFRLGKIRLRSHNSLLRTFAGADGLKTGFICDSGFNVIASATRDGRRLMAVVLGEPTGRERGVRAASLLEHGFQQHGWKTLFSATSIDNMPIDANAGKVHSVRKTVRAYVCGYRPPRATTAKLKLKKKD